MWDADRIRAAVARLPSWRQVLDLKGVATPGRFDVAPHLDAFDLPPSFAGRRVLDVSASSGWFSFLAEARGAETVAADLPSWADQDFPTWYRRKTLAELAPDALTALDHDYVHGPFELARDVLGSRVLRLRSRVYDLAEKASGRFDFALFHDGLDRLRDPVRALEAIAGVLTPQGMAVVAVPIDDAAPGAVARFFEDPSEPTWWRPTPETLAAWCRMAGFPRVELRGRFRLEARREPAFSETVQVVHARF
ncbi:MAG TPA: methyltransferase domain-containing protein [Planctomycetota bacterium]|nr:methyltransferase domain-containing protein [Planctomycetota bacterium]